MSRIKYTVTIALAFFFVFIYIKKCKYEKERESQIKYTSVVSKTFSYYSAKKHILRDLMILPVANERITAAIFEHIDENSKTALILTRDSIVAKIDEFSNNSLEKSSQVNLLKYSDSIFTLLEIQVKSMKKNRPLFKGKGQFVIMRTVQDEIFYANIDSLRKDSINTLIVIKLINKIYNDIDFDPNRLNLFYEKQD